MFELMASHQHSDGDGGTKALLAYAETHRPRNTKIVGTVGYCMSGQYADQRRDAFSRTRQGRGLDLRHATGHRKAGQPASRRLKTKAELYFGCAETDVYAPQEIIDKLKEAMKGRTTRSKSIPARITASLSQSGRSTTATPPSGIGAATGALSPQSVPEDRKHRCPSLYRLSGLRPDRDIDRADRDPLVCAGLYLRHRAGLDLCARDAQEREDLGRPGADHLLQLDDFILWVTVGIIVGGRTGYVLFYNLAVLRATSGRDLRIVERRHVVPRRLHRLRHRGDLFSRKKISRSCRSATSPPPSGRSGCSSGGSPSSSTANCGAGRRSQLALGMVFPTAGRCRAIRASSRGGARGHRAVHGARDDHPPGRSEASGLIIGSFIAIYGFTRSPANASVNPIRSSDSYGRPDHGDAAVCTIVMAGARSSSCS